MAKCTETCPKCGSVGITNGVANYWPCGSHDRRGFFYQSDLCEAREELAAANAEIERLRAEVEDARAYITTDDGSKLHIRNLLRCGMRSLKRKRGVFWANVADAFGVGSTSAHRLCRFVLLDPDTGERTEDHPHA